MTVEADRLSRIATQWTLVFEAHGSTDAAQAALQRLMLRYTRAVYRYLLGALRNEDAAHDLAQSFAVKFLEGKFGGARPEKGRFRNYLKTSVIHLIHDYQRSRMESPELFDPNVAEPAVSNDDADSERHFLNTWREELLERTWKALAEFNPIYHGALRLRVENPDMTSADMAARLNTELGKVINAALVRKSLQRAHEKFADLLIEEVAQTLEKPDASSLKAELEDIDLLRYCRTALTRWKDGIV